MKLALLAALLAVFCALALAVSQEETSIEALPGLQCVVCMNVVATLESQATKGENASILMNAIDKLCTRLHVEDWCVTYLKPQIAAVLPQIIAKLDPAMVCQKVKLCNNSQVAEKKVEAKVQHHVNSNLELAVKADDVIDTKCELCTIVVSYVKQVVGSNETEAAIQAALDKACQKIPFAKNLCSTVLEPYVMQIVEGLIAKEDPAVICAKIKLCKPAPPPVKREAELNVQCELCTAVLSYVKTQIGTDNTQAAIKNALDKACSKIPFAKGLCSAVLEPYLIQIVNGFATQQDPATICARVKLCN